MTDRPANVRLAVAGDEERIYNHLLGLHKENGLFSLSRDKSMAVIRSATERKGGIIGVIDGESGVEGSIGLQLSSWWYTENDYHLSEFWCFVREDCRATNHAKDLIQFAKWCAEEMKIPLFMGIVTTKRTAAKERLYRRTLPKVGAYFMWGANGEYTMPNETDNSSEE